MRRLAKKLMLCLALTAAAGAAMAAQEWQRFAPPDGGFSVSMPGKPARSNEDIPTKLGKFINNIYVVESGSGVYMVSYVDFPNPISDPAMIEAMFDSARDNATKATGGQLKEEKQIRLEGHPGREWFVSFPSGLGRARAYWVRNQRLYQAVVLMPVGKDAEAEQAREAMMIKFLDSFALTSAGAALRRK